MRIGGHAEKSYILKKKEGFLMKEYWIMPEIKKYVRRVLTRSFCTYTFHASTGCICTDIKLNTFRKICCRAYCEKISGNGNMKVTEEEAKNLFFIESMQHITGCSSYEIIRTEDIPELFHVVKA
jgi:hypothetical protein